MNSPKKRGRPKESNPRNKRFEVRMTQEQEQLLAECSEKAGITKTDVIIKGIELFRIATPRPKRMTNQIVQYRMSAP